MYERNYHSKAARTASDKKKPAKGGFRFSRAQWLIAAAIALFLLLAAGIVIAIRSPKLQVSDIVVQGAAVTDQSEVTDIVQQMLQGNRLRYFPRSSIIIVSTSSIAQHIRSAFPRFASVSVSRRGLRTLQVSVTEYQSNYLWCADDENAEQHCFFMDTQGLVFAPAPVFSGTIYPKLFGGQNGLVSVPDGGIAAPDAPFAVFRPFPPRVLAFVDAVIKQFHGFGMQPVEFHIDTEHQLRVVCMHGTDTIDVLFDPTTSSDTSLRALYTVLRTPAVGTALRPGAARELDYIDVRFEGKVIYKFKE